MEVKLGVKMDITPPVVFTLLPFKAFVQHEVLNFLFYFPFYFLFYFPLLPLLFLFNLKRCKNTEKPTKSSHYEC